MVVTAPYAQVILTPMLRKDPFEADWWVVLTPMLRNDLSREAED
jgi:hypothetical protein